MGKMHTVVLSLETPAASEAIVYSQKIGYPYTIRRLYIAWPSGSNRLVKVKPFLCTDNSSPATGEPEGTNLLQALSTTPYLIGNGDYREIEIGYTVNVGGMYLALHCKNEDGVVHVIDGWMQIEEL